jgi:hypothetical protein
MDFSSRNNPEARRPPRRDGSRSIEVLERALIRTWRVELQARGFTDEQAARLTMTKLLYLRRSLRR